MPIAGPVAYPLAGLQSAGGTNEKRTPNFPAQPESQLPKANWCWVAVCQSIYWCYGSHQTQQWIVSQCDPTNVNNDVPFRLRFAVETQLHFPILRLTASLATEVPANCTQFPVPIVIEWANSNGQTHAICAIGTGTAGGKPSLLIYDPLPASESDTGADLIKLVPISVLENGYLEHTTAQSRGHWTEAFAVTGHAG